MFEHCPFSRMAVQKKTLMRSINVDSVVGQRFSPSKVFVIILLGFDTFDLEYLPVVRISKM